MNLLVPSPLYREPNQAERLWAPIQQLFRRYFPKKYTVVTSRDGEYFYVAEMAQKSPFRYWMSCLKELPVSAKDENLCRIETSLTYRTMILNHPIDGAVYPWEIVNPRRTSVENLASPRLKHYQYMVQSMREESLLSPEVPDVVVVTDE